MSPQERTQLQAFLDQLVQARVPERDGDAGQMIQAACARQPDAAYLLVQRCLLQQQALQQAQDELSRLRQNKGGFFDNGSWGNSALPARPAPAAGAGLGSGWLGNIATTAAGVVAGGFLFQGIEHLLHGNESNNLFGETNRQSYASDTLITNNFFETSPQGGLDSLDDGLPDDQGDSWL